MTGFGPVVGEAIVASDDVDMVSFTGSTRAGKRVSEVASGTVKKVAFAGRQVRERGHHADLTVPSAMAWPTAT